MESSQWEKSKSSL